MANSTGSIARDNKRIGYNLRSAALRLMAKNPALHQKDIAAKAGLHPVTFSRILNGAGTSEATIEKIAAVVGVSPERILAKGQRQHKFSIKTLEEVLSDDRKLSQFIGAWDTTEVSWARTEMWKIVNALQSYRRSLQRGRGY